MPKQKSVLPEYDFAEALALTAPERLTLCLKTLASREQMERMFGFSPVLNAGATEAELHEIERGNGELLPEEYRAFLSRCCCLELTDGLTICGVSHVDDDGIGSAWVSEDHGTDAPCWVVGDYWRYADGDQLLILPDEPEQPVVLYLHEQGPTLEVFAPCFSLALWRLVHEEMTE